MEASQSIDTARRGAARDALTLVELLVVIVLITTLLTTAIPVLSPGGDTRKIREASRAVNAFFAGARARAIETGRPYGVAIKRLSAVTGDPADNGVGVELSYVEAPPAYAGLDTSSVARVGLWPVGIASNDIFLASAPQPTASRLRRIGLQLLRYTTDAGNGGLPAGLERDPVPPDFFREGDIVEVDGAFFRLVDPARDGLDANANVFRGLADDASVDATEGERWFISAGILPFLVESVVVDDPLDLRFRYASSGLEVPAPEAAAGPNGLGFSNTVSDIGGLSAPYWTSPAPYKIHRKAVPAAGAPLQLPAGAAIDLQASGLGERDNSGEFARLHRERHTFDNNETPPPGAPGEVLTDPIVVMFSPEGSIESATFRPNDPNDPNDPSLNAPPAAEQAPVTSYVALLVGRRELIPAVRDDGQPSVDEPINLGKYATTLDDEGTQETLGNYNWLSGDSRWVVLSAQSGTVATVENATISTVVGMDANDDSRVSLEEQFLAVRENVVRRVDAGGR